MSSQIVIGKRRFTCLSPTLVRMEFSPDGVFEDRRSFVAHAAPAPIPFSSVTKKDGDLKLETGKMTLVSRENDKAFFPANLEAQWVQNGLLQYWRPGDRDYQNFGGTVRSLDRYGHTARMDGVHVADSESPDQKASAWLAWLQCEDDLPFYAASPQKPEGANSGDWHRFAMDRNHGGRLLERTMNWVTDSHRFSPGVLSRSGYFLLNDSSSPVMDEEDFPSERDRPGYQDWYLFAYGSDFRAALADFVRLCGPAPIPTHQAFGIMFSRWPAYAEPEAKQIVSRFAKEGYPLSVLVLDMEWHREGWGNWDWNPETYPDPRRFFQWCHRRQVAVTLNDHPLDVRANDSHFDDYLERAGTRERVRTTSYNGKTIDMVDVDICNRREARAFLDVCHTHILDDGLDFWWNDGCKGRLNGAINQLVCNKLCFEESERGRRRGMLLARYGGLGSHRYGAFFTGDTESCWEILALQCEFNVRAGHVGLAYVSHDIGGFYTPRKTDKIDPELYTRWLQFGVFSPILRFHSAPGSGSRQPWDYDGDVDGACGRWLRARNALLPYIYSAAREHHETGMPIVRGLFLDAPDNRDAERFDQYLFGPDLLVAPVLDQTGKRSVYLPAGVWYEFESTRRQHGGLEITRTVPLTDIPVYVRAGSIIPCQNPDTRLHSGPVGDLILDIYPGADGSSTLYEDDGASRDYAAKQRFCKTTFALTTKRGQLRLTAGVSAGKPLAATRNLKLRLFTDDAPKALRMNGKKLETKPGRPAGAAGWLIDVGQISAGDPLDITLG